MKNGTFLLIMVAMALAGGVLVGKGIMLLQESRCRHAAEMMDRDWDYSFWTKCMVKTDDGSYVGLDQYKVVEVED